MELPIQQMPRPAAPVSPPATLVRYSSSMPISPAFFNSLWLTTSWSTVRQQIITKIPAYSPDDTFGRSYEIMKNRELVSGFSLTLSPICDQATLCARASANPKRTTCKLVVQVYDVCTHKLYDLLKTISVLPHDCTFRVCITLDHSETMSMSAPRLSGRVRCSKGPTTSTFLRRRRPFGWNIHCSFVSRTGYNTSHHGGPTLSRSQIEKLAVLWMFTRVVFENEPSDNPNASRELSMVIVVDSMSRLTLEAGRELVNQHSDFEPQP
ncbi:hypothetical protein C8Q76DRAFT_792535 [Earliella scabrosa]|nr:hypothetical protein C8Q76DRAFT_792535 [Earliella scabrosa]